jgi:hypothetical protein
MTNFQWRKNTLPIDEMLIDLRRVLEGFDEAPSNEKFDMIQRETRRILGYCEDGISVDCTPNHLCQGSMVHLPMDEMCDKCGQSMTGQALPFNVM